MAPLAQIPRATVHPRSRGEHSRYSGLSKPDIGSSPLARGTRRIRIPPWEWIRFIPARAGNTQTPRRGRRSPAVHPRSRGEHPPPAFSLGMVVGSSPLARGTLVPMPPGAARGRFIPARAGNTGGVGADGLGSAVHPRSRGEHVCVTREGPMAGGSSPLARGTRDVRRLVHPLDRFIPARAGNTVTASLPRGLWHGSSPLARGTLVGRDRPESANRFIPARAGNTVTASLPRGLWHGSSPLARGTLVGRDRPESANRFIPARAGNTGPSSWYPDGRPVHPRSRGEHSFVVAGFLGKIGSSPLARGTRLAEANPPRWVRFIPARAGNTVSAPVQLDQSKVHPRSRGEHRGQSSKRTFPAGSSPLARGTHAAPVRRADPVRFIPARAGNTASSTSRQRAASVHPRSRGEHVTSSTLRISTSGSSPLARGTRPGQADAAGLLRFIPARAGNTPPRPPRRRRSSVHPRSRGEHLLMAADAQWTDGSSPLARGTLRPSSAPRSRIRFIPARAGNTCGRPPWPASRAVHPRSRGEHFLWLPADEVPAGSSPLARGTPVRDGNTAYVSRFIPARAGNTR